MTRDGQPARTGESVEHMQEIERRLMDLEAELTGLRAQWNSPATEAYQTAQQQWRTALRDLSDLLREPSPRSAGPGQGPRPPAAPAPERRFPRWA